jgi:hypothetical protein
MTSLFKLGTSSDKENLDESSSRIDIVNQFASISEQLDLNISATCPLFLLKEGIDHRFEFLDFAPDLSIRQQFYPIDGTNSFIDDHENHSNKTKIIHHKTSSHSFVPTTQILFNPSKDIE